MALPRKLDFDGESGKVISPKALCHVVLRTASLKAMQKFYVDFLGGRVAHANEMLSFITYDEEHHRIALVEVPGTEPKISTTCGLEHIAFGFPTLFELLLSYRQRLKTGIKPWWCINHGPTTSIYYKDPDGNMLETQVDNFETVEKADEFMKSKSFAENPIGTEFDPENLISRMLAGENENILKRRVETGPRQVDVKDLA
ncbi:hypothetical protein PV08_01048 [Exophiala spinifera]|uniref:VOC domain-containing protein n=1 Tax=Exophiala spinifera TaxID=91928 RepID=A0A0D2BNI6_9EURO|nr:uncharacterized protein PV08_01048 [Exophiala spinifera]KIW20473.1 hypothetical protein PV08_01048 [Exophiala spinifera]